MRWMLGATVQRRQEEEVDMDMGQGFIDATQELNVDRGTLPCSQ
jgi:hypothetical protein